MNIQELKQYVEDKKKRNAEKWKQETAIHGHCKPFTDQDYSKNSELIFNGKKSYKRKFTHSALWESTKQTQTK
jgi:hypothetical protein